MLDNLVDIVLPFRSGAYKRHVALEDVPKLREFVEVMVTQETADMSHAIIFLMSEQLRSVFLCIHSHASELINGERLSETSDALLLENSRSTVLVPDQNIANEEERRKDNKRYSSNKTISNPLRVALKGVHSVRDKPWVVLVIIPFDVWWNLYCGFGFRCYFHFSSGVFC